MQTNSPSDPLAVGYVGASELLGVSVSTVERIVKAGTLPAFNLGRLIRIRRCDIDAYMAKQVAARSAEGRSE